MYLYRSSLLPNRINRRTISSRAIPDVYLTNPSRPNQPLIEQVSETSSAFNPFKNIPILKGPEPQWSAEDFKKATDNFDVAEVIVDQTSSNVKAITEDGVEHPVKVRITPDIIDNLIEHGVIVRYDNPEKFIQHIFYYLQIFVIISVSLTIAYSILSRNGAAQGITSIGQSKAKEADGEKITTTFDDIAGIDYAKAELEEVVEFLKNPEKFTRVGAKIPKGCLLVGPAGCGKTLLARAVAGTADVPFFSCSASEFIEMFVGVGASRIRSLFEKAKAKAPCIIFIDEIDAVGKSRSSSMGFGPGNDERDQTINQLLTEMDGFEMNNGIVVIAATNRADILDKALLRPGRFDRTIYIDSPDIKGRTDILTVHCRNKPLAEDVKLEDISRITAGFSGAELENIANEAAINAARRNSETINKHDFEEALEKLVMGPLKKSRIISEEKKNIVSVHESGHTITALCVGDYDAVRKVSIVPRGSAGGVTLFEPSMDRVDSGLLSRNYLENKLVVALGGRAAEEIVFGAYSITTGASNDMEQVYKIARMMITRYGFSEELGTIGWDWEGSSISADTARKIDEEMMRIVNKSYTRAKNIIENNMEALRRLSQALLEKESLDAEEIKSVVKNALR